MREAIKFANAKITDCEDVRIMQIELSSHPSWQEIYDSIPTEMKMSNDYQGFHSIHTGEVIRTLCPKAKIFLGTPTNECFEWAKNNDIDIISVSIDYSNADDILEAETGKNTFLLIASGNKNLMSNESKKKHWTSIGAVSLLSGKPLLEGYSGIGEELDFVGLTGMTLKDNKGHRGTSISTPFIAGLLGQYIQLHKDFFGYKPTIAKMYQFMLNNTIDMQMEGHDTSTGNGLFILPKEIKFGIDPKDMRRAKFEEWVLEFQPDGLNEKQKKNLLKVWGDYLNV